MAKIHGSFMHNTSALSALDMAIYDLCSVLNLPLYKLLGGFRNLAFTSVTISANSLILCLPMHWLRWKMVF